MGIFSSNQPVYAEHGIATFPVSFISRKDERVTKKPAVKHWDRIGLPASRQFASKFTDADGIGFTTNRRNKIAILDIDTVDERVLADAIDRHGKTPIVSRTASGKYHAWYKFNGERRRIRPFGELPIDLLGHGGLVVAPPSVLTKGAYQFIQGTLSDIGWLPVMHGLTGDMYDTPRSSAEGLVIPSEHFEAATQVDDTCIPEGTRNNDLWRFCMAQAAMYRTAHKSIIERSALIDLARQRNSDCVPPLPDSEVIAIASSAWGYETRDSNWYGTGRRVVASHDEVDQLSPDAFYLLAVLRRHHWGRDFVIANAMHESLGWGLLRFRKARRELERAHKIKIIDKGNQWKPPLYGWSTSSIY